ncbi:MAG: fibro-slime domain-containing protein [Phycisphaerales bacterium]
MSNSRVVNEFSITKAVLCSTALLALTGAAVAIASPQGTSSQNDAVDYSNLPDTLSLDAVIRDFRAKNDEGGHPDFQAYTGSTTVGLVEMQLGPDRVPVVNDLRGWKITSEYKDSAGRKIMPASYSSELGDQEGAVTPGGTGNGLTSIEAFDQWYKDVPGVNASVVVPLTLTKIEGTNRYVFDSATDEPYDSIGGFFPINGDLYGNYGSTGKNFHFTTEVRTQFIFKRGTGQVFKFTGDDDVWVFVGDQLVIDIGGLHSKKEQNVSLDRFDWLEDGQKYSLDIFHAERRTTQSNFRIETTIELRSVELPPTAALYD